MAWDGMALLEVVVVQHLQEEANKDCKGRRKKRKHVLNMKMSSSYFGPLAQAFGTIPRLMKRRNLGLLHSVAK